MKKKTTGSISRAGKRRVSRVSRRVGITLAEAKAHIARGQDRTDWTRVDAMTDEDIERAIDADPDAAPRLDASFWRNARLFVQAVDAPKTTITLRVDTDVLEALKQHGQGYQSRINAVLRAYVTSRHAG